MEIKTSSDGIKCIDIGTNKNLFSFGPSPTCPQTIVDNSEKWNFIKIPKKEIISIDTEMSPFENTRSEIKFIGEPIFEKENKKENKKEKEKKKIMELLDLYEKFQIENIKKSFDKQIEQLLEKDPLVLVAKKYNEEIKLLVDDEEQQQINLLDIERMLTQGTKNERNNILKQIKEATYKLKDKCAIIKAHLELADTFEEKQEILKSYNVIDKNGKLNVLDNNCEEEDEINIKVEALDLPEEKVRKEKKSWKK